HFLCLSLRCFSVYWMSIVSIGYLVLLHAFVFIPIMVPGSLQGAFLVSGRAAMRYFHFVAHNQD
ncbi:hypothetical protein N8V88_28715, partial [Enterobacter hormaechei subsp. oharae]|nr:hypothetical protein [Enterobacter hormaechei subsp. oharae]